ncbi:MAG: ribonuclease J [Beijerinckiaceae bacterium]
MADKDELVFVPLGGLGEIGMNAALYGWGPPGRRQWIMVDCGVAFAGPELPGIDLMYANMAFIEKMKANLKGIIITHAHEDHIGAIPFVWPRFGCPIYATRFAADLLTTRRLSDANAPDVDILVKQPGKPFAIGPFEIEMVPVAHSIPEATALAIRTPAGTIVHTGDWKIDPEPGVGWPTDEARFRQIGDEGVLALMCDSTNILRDGESPSERDVAATLRELVASAPHRVLVTTFASNVARMRAVALAAQAAGRSVVMAGRSIERVNTVARELGYFDGLPEFLPVDSFGNLPRNKIVILATGSQGEARAALARIAEDEHPRARLAPGDRVVFSSRPIPGNEKGINRIINGLAKQGIEVLTDRDGLVHVSGHPRRSEVAQMYGWLRPQIAIPAHGEAMHLAGHAKFARERGVPHVLSPHNGDAVLLWPGEPAIVDQVPHGRTYLDGLIPIDAGDKALRERRALSFAGIVSVALAVTSKGEIAGDPDVLMEGLPDKTSDGRPMDEIVDRAIFETLDSLPRARRRDADAISTAVERGVRGTVGAVWGKRPKVHVLVVEV